MPGLARMARPSPMSAPPRGRVLPAARRPREAQDLVEGAIAAVGARLVALARFDPLRRRVEPLAVAGLDSRECSRARAAARRLGLEYDPIGRPTAAGVNSYLRAVYVHGETVEAPFAELMGGVCEAAILELAAAQGGLRHSLVYPLRVNGRVGGSLAVHLAKPPTDLQRRTTEAFARQAALTFENARLLTALQEQVAELQRSREQITAAEERLRREIAELLHSGVQTRLVVAWHRLGQCERLIESDPAAARALLGEVRAQIDQIREQEVRQASHLLHPSIIRIGLVPAIRSLSARFALYLMLNLQVDPRVAQLDDPGDNRIPENVRLALYRAVEEALNNVARHAEAQRVEISLHLDAGERLKLQVRDDGRGFDRARLTPGLGLNSIAARVGQTGGAWTISSTRGQGTRLTVFVPLREVGSPGEPIPPAPERRSHVDRKLRSRSERGGTRRRIS